MNPYIVGAIIVLVVIICFVVANRLSRRKPNFAEPVKGRVGLSIMMLRLMGVDSDGMKRKGVWKKHIRSV